MEAREVNWNSPLCPLIEQSAEVEAINQLRKEEVYFRSLEYHAELAHVEKGTLEDSHYQPHPADQFEANTVPIKLAN